MSVDRTTARLGLIRGAQGGMGALQLESSAHVSNLLPNPMDFGAVGDGAADDTVSLQNWLDSLPVATGGRLWLPPPANFYRITGPLVATRSNTRIVGGGSEIRQIDPTFNGLSYAPGVVGVHLDGVVLLGASTPVTVGVTGVRLPAYSSVTGCESGGWNINYQVDGVGTRIVGYNRVRSAIGTGSGQGYGVLLLAPDCEVVGPIMESIGRHGVYVSGHAVFGGALRARVVRAIIQCDAVAGGGSGIKVYATVAQPALTGVKLLGNSVRHTNLTGGNALGIEFQENVSDCSAVGNDVAETDSQALRVFATAAGAPARCVFANNQVITAAGYFIRVEATGGSAPTDCEFLGNVTDRNSTTAILDNGVRTIIRGNGEYPDSSPEYAFVDGDPTPSVYKGEQFLANNVGATVITAFDDARPGQKISIRFSNGNTTIQNNAGILLLGGANFVGTANDLLVLERRGTIWYERSRSVN